MNALAPELHFPEGPALDAARAVAAGHLPALDAALTQLPDGADAAGDSGMSLLCFALALGQLPALQLLLRRGADPNRAVPAGAGEWAHPVALAAGFADAEPLRLLLAHGGDPNGQRRGVPALCGAIYAQNWRALRVLAERPGTDLNRPNIDGATPLLLLAYLNQFEHAAYLLGKGANPDPADHWGGTVAFAVQRADPAPESEAHRWLPRVRQLLELRGVRFPVPDPSVEAEKTRAAEARQRQRWGRTAEGLGWHEQINRAAADSADDGTRLVARRKAAQLAYEDWQAQQVPPAARQGGP